MVNAKLYQVIAIVLSGTEYNYTCAEERWNVCCKGRLLMQPYICMHFNCKVLPYSLPSVGPGADLDVQAVSL